MSIRWVSKARGSAVRAPRRSVSIALGGVLGFAFAALVAVPVALAYHQITYWAPPVPNVPFATGNTSDGYVAREYNQAFHLAGKTYTVWYQDSVGNISCAKSDTNNPTSCSGHFNAKAAFTQDVDDSSSTHVTSQTTNPSP